MTGRADATDIDPAKAILLRVWRPRDPTQITVVFRPSRSGDPNCQVLCVSACVYVEWKHVEKMATLGCAANKKYPGPDSHNNMIN
jgi:hypothetical protein